MEEERFVTLGAHHLVWASVGEIRANFNLVSIDETGEPIFESLVEELREGMVLALKDGAVFLDLPQDGRFELFLFKRKDQNGPARAALESIQVYVPDHLEE